MKSKVKEIFLMRAFACSSVVLLHSIAIIQSTFDLSTTTSYIFKSLQLLLLYSTPMFIFISEFVLSYSYGSTLPKGFFLKRIKYVLVPYIFFGVFYGFVWAYSFTITDIPTILKQIALYVFRGDYHGYFVLIIFQFYILHKFLGPKLDKLPIKTTLIISFIFNVLYLTFFNYTVWISYPSIPFAKYLWSRGYFMVFPGWIFYFLLGYYSGRNMSVFSLKAIKLKWLLGPLSLFLGSIILLQYNYDLLRIISTKRPDIVAYTLIIILLSFYISSLFKSVPGLINMINRSSYGIYLIHPFIQQLLQNFIIKSKFEHPFLIFIGVFIISLYVPALIVIWINKLPHGYYFVGKLGPKPRKEKNTSFYPKSVYKGLVKPSQTPKKKAEKEL